MKIIKFNQNNNCIEWTDISNNDKSNDNDKSKSIFRLFHSSKPSNQNDYDNNNHEDESNVTTDFNTHHTTNSKDDSYRRISIKSIMKIQKGLQSDIFYTTNSLNGNGRQFKFKNLDAHCCLTIVALNRTLDIKLSTSIERDRVVRALSILLHSYKVDTVVFE